MALLGPLVLLVLPAPPEPPEEDEPQERLRVADPTEPALVSLRRLEERLPAPPPIELRAPPEPPEGLAYYYPTNPTHRGKRRRRWPEGSAGGSDKNQRQRRRDARRRAL